MAKLYFRYGAMNSAKTLNLLAVAHNYAQQQRKVVLIKPRLDVRWSAKEITSRTGLSMDADLLVDEGTRLTADGFHGVACVLVDEAQFLAPQLIDDLRALTVDPGVPVICYGLRTNFRTELFPGSKRLMELADTIEEIKVTCVYCPKKATCNLRLIDGRGVLDGPSVLLGDSQYKPVCWEHWRVSVA